MRIQRTALIIGMVILGFIGPASSQNSEVRIVSPDQVEWRTVALFPDVKTATVSGNPQEGMYSIYAVYKAGGKAPSHVHPDARIVTVISGTFYSGIGTEFDEKNLRVLRPGLTIIIPANTPHFGWAKEGEVMLLETGAGPTATKLAK